ncbi:MAG: polyprenyl synthetase family protein [Candidatus Parcubacteria bacterium]|nr:polyprenyl synthetase family protein [Candidatus Parcubacteria bacterium]
MNFTKEELKNIFQEISTPIEPKILEILGRDIDERSKEIVNYQILTGGKRLRPILAILSCLVMGKSAEHAIAPAAGIEIIHNYSLMIDDIIDNSVLRRKKPTTWFKYGKSIAQCIAVHYSAAVPQAANLSNNPALISEIFSKAMKVSADGEILDILFEQRGREDEPYVVKNRFLNINADNYIDMIKKKAAFLFQASTEVGGISAKASEPDLKELRDYGYNLGVAFQIKDDILDIFGKEETFGKEIGKDIIERKMGNIVLLFTLKDLSPIDKVKFLRILREERRQTQDFQEVLELIQRAQSYQKAKLLGEKYILKAKESLVKLPQNKWNKVLSDIADMAMEREK